MTSSSRFLAALVALAAVCVSAAAQGTSKRVDVTTIAPLVFGTFVASGNGSVTVGPDGSRSLTGLFSPDMTFNPARFDVRIQGARQVTVVLPGEASLANASGATMKVDSFSSIPQGTITVPRPGDSADFTVGATLHVAGGQAPGLYQGSYLVVFSLVN